MLCLLFVNQTPVCARRCQRFSREHSALRPRIVKFFKLWGAGLISPLYFENRPIEPGYLLSRSKLVTLKLLLIDNT